MHYLANLEHTAKTLLLLIMIRRTTQLQHSKNSATVSCDSKNNIGTHWVAHVKNRNLLHCLESFGNLKPSGELSSYFGDMVKTNYNIDAYQNYTQTNKNA